LITESEPSGASASETTTDVLTGLFRTHGLAMIRLALMLVGDQATAEDVVQDTFVALHRALPRLRDRGSEITVSYLRVSVVNGCRSVQRARRRPALFISGQHDPPVWSAEAAVIAAEDRRAVLSALAKLPRRAREVVALRYFLDLTQAEIAQVLGISRGTVASTLSRSLTRLGAELQEEQ
jgi:RNA polymerase sigma-70 factor (sigma-E family)